METNPQYKKIEVFKIAGLILFLLLLIRMVWLFLPFGSTPLFAGIIILFHIILFGACVAPLFSIKKYISARKDTPIKVSIAINILSLLLNLYFTFSQVTLLRAVLHYSDKEHFYTMLFATVRPLALYVFIMIFNIALIALLFSLKKEKQLSAGI